MRVPKGWVPVLSAEIAEDLLKREQIDLKMSKDQVIALMEELL
jgi:hypothetical protein